MVADKSYLERKHNTWVVVVQVPKELQAAAGRLKFKKSLKTSDLGQANRLKHAHIGAFKQKIEEIRQGIGDPKTAVAVEGQEWRGVLRSANTWPEDNPQGASEQEILEAALDQRADQIDEELRTTFRANASSQGVQINDHYETWADEALVAGQTRSQHKSAVKRYLEWAGELVTVEQTDRVKAGQYVSYLLASSGLSRQTIKRHTSSLSQLWEWFDSKGLGRKAAYLENVWLRHKLGRKPKSSTRIGLTDEQIIKLLKGRSRSKKFAQLLSDLLRLALLSGARLDELCALKRSEVQKREDGYWITVSDGKTDAAVRAIPLHKDAVPIIERRLKDKDEYVFAGLVPGGPDDKRSWYVSKAYGRFRNQDDVGVSGKWQDFHALRNTFIDMMEGLEIPESTVKLIVGHKRVSMTYGHYSKGKRVELRKTIDALEYSDAVMRALRQLPSLQVKGFP